MNLKLNPEKLHKIAKKNIRSLLRALLSSRNDQTVPRMDAIRRVQTPSAFTQKSSFNPLHFPLNGSQITHLISTKKSPINQQL